MVDDTSNNSRSMMAFLKEIAATVNTGDLEPKEQLSSKVWEISEAGYCAGWTVNIEFFLWKAVLNGSKVDFGMKEITELEIQHLKTLAEQSGGWWYWSDKENEAVFVSLDEWQVIYQQFLEKQSIQ